MDIVAVILGALAPGVFWLWFFNRKNGTGRTPKKYITGMFFLGMLSLFPAMFLERPFGGFLFVQIVFVAPVLEEVIKFLLVRLTVFRSREFEKPIDGITYAATVALGFASAENIFYIVATYLAPQIALGIKDPMFGLGMVWKLYLIRMLLTIPGHALWSGMWGYALGHAKFSGSRLGIPPGGLMISMVLHILFNYFIITHPVGAAGMLVLLPVTWRMFYDRIDLALSVKSGLINKAD